MACMYSHMASNSSGMATAIQPQKTGGSDGHGSHSSSGNNSMPATPKRTSTSSPGR